MAEQAGYYPCTCIALDVQAYGGNNDRRQSEIQHDLPRLLSRAALHSGLDRSRWNIQAKGDEQLAVAPLDGSEPRIVDDYIRHITAGLAAYNEDRKSSARMRIRAAVHHGPVEVADNGFAGRTVVTTCRLLNSAPLRRALTAAPGTDLALVLSDEVYLSTVAGGHTTLTAGGFRRVTVQEKEYEAGAWLWVPGHDVHTLELGPERPENGPGEGEFAAAEQGRGAGRRDAENRAGAGSGVRNDINGHQVNVNNFTDRVDLRGSVLGFGNVNG
ncbi:hypothetical protein FCH28_34865 [Streptomyces piniterrae]|uniref:Adenylate/guanylate cyclase domain-containing protein n=1 Tax=Streptomyces piniterrae TaxID=2571125 RepID=A0A4U0MNH0_9ACTN|nr:hypothetical protein [Streptomyces piniterrae]TJZ42203.1 hypothetical protein FCH28_34865 [Streptomyces piniterrae]